MNFVSTSKLLRLWNFPRLALFEQSRVPFRNDLGMKFIAGKRGYYSLGHVQVFVGVYRRDPHTRRKREEAASSVIIGSVWFGWVNLKVMNLV